MDNIGKRIKTVRISQGLTLKDLAELSGVGFARISKFERGMEKPGVKILASLEQALGVIFDNDETTISEINTLFERFFSALFYQDVEIEYFKSMIETNQNRYLVSQNYYRILLIKFIIAILKKDIEQAMIDKDLLDSIITPGSADEQLYLEYKGIMKLQAKELDDGINYLKDSLRINENEKINAMVSYHLSMFFKEMNVLESAKRYGIRARLGFSELGSFRRVISCDILLASVYIRWGNYKHALKILDSCLDSLHYVDCENTTRALILRNKSWVLILNKNYEKALTVLDEADRLQSNNSNVVMYRIWCYYCLRKYNQAQHLISNNHKLNSDPYYASRFKLFIELVYLADANPTKAVIIIAKNVYKEFCKKKRYDLIGFYLDIVIDLYKRSEDLENQVYYLEEKVKFLEIIQRQESDYR